MGSLGNAIFNIYTLHLQHIPIVDHFAVGDGFCLVDVSLSGDAGSSGSRRGENTRQMQEHHLWNLNPIHLDVFYKLFALNKEPMTDNSSDVTMQVIWTKKKSLLQRADATCWTAVQPCSALSLTDCKAAGAIWRSQTRSVCVCEPRPRQGACTKHSLFNSVLGPSTNRPHTK